MHENEQRISGCLQIPICIACQHLHVSENLIGGQTLGNFDCNLYNLVLYIAYDSFLEDKHCCGFKKFLLLILLDKLVDIISVEAGGNFLQVVDIECVYIAMA